MTLTLVSIFQVSNQTTSWLYRSVLQASLTEGPSILPHLVFCTLFSEQLSCYLDCWEPIKSASKCGLSVMIGILPPQPL